MANIAVCKVKQVDKWKKLEDLIEGFNPSEGSVYLIQNIGYSSLVVYEGSEAPADSYGNNIGFQIANSKCFKWKKTSDYLFVKAFSNQATFNIAEGE